MLCLCYPYATPLLATWVVLGNVGTPWVVMEKASLYFHLNITESRRSFVPLHCKQKIQMAKRTQEDYYKESKRIRAEVLQEAELLKGNPIRFIITNEITMRVEITKNDLKTIVSKNVGDDKFNAIKNALAKDIPGYLAKATYLGWRPVAEGKHFESAYFAYFSRELGCRTILCMRRLADGNIYKPYAIINDHTFAAAETELRK